MEASNVASWAVLELMGHVRLAGRVSEEERFGTKMGRIDIPQPDGSFTTQFFSGGSIYRMTPCTEEVARAVAKSSEREPVYAWDIRRQIGLQEKETVPTYDDDQSEQDDDGLPP